MQRFLLYFLFCIFIPNAAFTWWDLGHMTVAHIAFHHLDPKVKKRIDFLVHQFNAVHPNIHTFDEMSRWPDMLHSNQQIYLYYHWHYIDVPFSTDHTLLKNTIDSDNILRTLHTLILSLKNKNNNNDYETARMLAFLIHFVGDIHQPLHTVTRISMNHPNGDRGGNSYRVMDAQGEITSLHKLWDNGFGIYNDTLSSHKIHRLAKMISDQYPSNFFGKKTMQLEPKQWVHEGMLCARHFVYATPENEKISAHYMTQGMQIAEQQVALAGYRLANLLNEIFSVSS